MDHPTNQSPTKYGPHSLYLNTFYASRLRRLHINLVPIKRNKVLNLIIPRLRLRIVPRRVLQPRAVHIDSIIRGLAFVWTGCVSGCGYELVLHDCGGRELGVLAESMDGRGQVLGIRT